MTVILLTHIYVKYVVQKKKKKMIEIQITLRKYPHLKKKTRNNIHLVNSLVFIYSFLVVFFDLLPSRHMRFMQRYVNVDAAS